MSEPASAFGPSSLLTNLLIREAAPPAPCLEQVHMIGTTLVGYNAFFYATQFRPSELCSSGKKGKSGDQDLKVGYR
jgi:hypothetical protein